MPARVDFSEANPPLMFTGIQILEPKIFDYIPRGVFSHSTREVYPQAIAKGEILAAHVACGRWFELSTIQRYLDISLQLLAETGRSFTAGTNCQISESAEIEQSILWDNVVLESGARVRRAVLADNVTIGAREVIEDAAVVRASLVQGKTPPEKALKGKFRGDNFVVPLTG
jgi:NDP-sugar pyrophosphorylase family protein